MNKLNDKCSIDIVAVFASTTVHCPHKAMFTKTVCWNCWNSASWPISFLSRAFNGQIQTGYVVIKHNSRHCPDVKNFHWIYLCGYYAKNFLLLLSVSQNVSKSIIPFRWGKLKWTLIIAKFLPLLGVLIVRCAKKNCRSCLFCFLFFLPALSTLYSNIC